MGAAELLSWIRNSGFYGAYILKSKASYALVATEHDSLQLFTCLPLNSTLLPASQPILSNSSQLLFHVDYLYLMTSFPQSLRPLQFWMVHISLSPGKCSRLHTTCCALST